MTIMYKYYGTASWCTHMIYSSLYIMIYQYHVYLLSLWYSRNNCLWHCHFSIIFSCICINMRCLDFCSATQSSGGVHQPKSSRNSSDLCTAESSMFKLEKICFLVAGVSTNPSDWAELYSLGLLGPWNQSLNLIFSTKYVIAKSLDCSSSIDLHKMLGKK